MFDILFTSFLTDPDLSGPRLIDGRDDVDSHAISQYPQRKVGESLYYPTRSQLEAGANTEKLNQILDSDEGARYLGEWSFGVNPYITFPMRDTLFDEKIAGSFHLTPGQCYKEASNGNDSQIHWDIVCRQDPAVGGGEIWFDGVLIRKDGRFVLPELQGLNPESLTQ